MIALGRSSTAAVTAASRLLASEGFDHISLNMVPIILHPTGKQAASYKADFFEYKEIRYLKLL